MMDMMMRATVSVAGVTFKNADGEDRQGLLRRITHTHGVQVTLEREPDNAYDPDAIKVIAHTGGRSFQIGYVPRSMSHYVARAMDRQKRVWTGGVHVVGGYDEMPTLGCKFAMMYDIA